MAEAGIDLDRLGKASRRNFAETLRNRAETGEFRTAPELWTETALCRKTLFGYERLDPHAGL